MILVYGIRERLDPVKSRLSDAIHDCMQTVLGLPAGKRAHRFFPMAAEDFFFPDGRSPAYTVIEINMMQGRTEATKKALIKALFQRIETDVGIAPVDIEIILNEQPRHCWGFRGMTGDEAADLTYKIDI